MILWMLLLTSTGMLNLVIARILGKIRNRSTDLFFMAIDFVIGVIVSRFEQRGTEY